MTDPAARAYMRVRAMVEGIARMTLIARLRFPHPIYIGDVLLSGIGTASSQVSLPLFRDAHLIAEVGSQYRVVAARQKLNILNPNLIVAWSGSELQARRLLRLLNEAVLAGASSGNDALLVIFNEDDGDRDNVGIIGSIVRNTIDDEGVMRTLIGNFSYGCEVRETIEGVEVRASGSGSATFRETLPEIIGKSKAVTEAHEQSYLSGVISASTLVGIESAVNGANIAQGWGGAFEIAYVNGGELHKLDRVAHVFCEVKKRPDGLYGMAISPDLIVSKYVGQSLVVTRCRYSNDGAEHDIHVYNPLLGPKIEPSIEATGGIDYSHNILCCHLQFSEKPTELSAIIEDGRGFPLQFIKLSASDNQTTFSVEPEFGKKIIARAQERWDIQIA